MYSGIDSIGSFQPVPYAFYDVGMVWNEDRDQVARATGSSAGGGVRIVSDIGLTANLGVAFPLTRNIANPLVGDGNDPRYLMQVGYGF
jgi:hemolysin activation/secretion protein